MRFYVLHKDVGGDAETRYEPVGRVRLGDAAQCPRCGTYIGLMGWLPPYIVEIELYGKHVGDLAFGVSDYLISQKFLSCWQQHGLVGIDSPAPVEISSVQPRSRRKDVSEFFQIAPKRSKTTRIDDARSVILYSDSAVKKCDCCGGGAMRDAIFGLHIDEGSWSGEDLFCPWGINGVTVVTDRVVGLVEKYDLKNVPLKPIEEYQWNPLHRPRPK